MAEFVCDGKSDESFVLDVASVTNSKRAADADQGPGNARLGGLTGFDVDVVLPSDFKGADRESDKSTTFHDLQSAVLRFRAVEFFRHGLLILLAEAVFFRQECGEFGEIVLVFRRHLLEVAEEFVYNGAGALRQSLAAKEVVDGNC
jgi:hypothetical protein